MKNRLFRIEWAADAARFLVKGTDKNDAVETWFKDRAEARFTSLAEDRQWYLDRGEDDPLEVEEIIFNDNGVGEFDGS